MSQLPPGWAQATTNDLFTFVTSGSRGWARYYTDEGAPFIRVGNLQRASITPDLGHIQRVNPPAGAEGTRTRVVPNDILISITADLGRVALMADIKEAYYINQHVALARPVKAIDPRYLAWYLSSDTVQRQWMEQQRGVTKLGLRLDDIRSIGVPIPPHPEQERIVAAIEEQFSRLSAGMAALSDARRRLEQLRNQSILTLIKGKGKKIRLAEVSDIRLGRQRSPQNHTGPNMVPYVRAANVTWGGLDLTDVKAMNFSPAEVSTFRLQRGDVLVAEASGSAAEVGKPAIWDESLPVCCFQNTLLRLRSEHLLPEYLYFVVLALARSGAFARTSKGVGIHHLSRTGLANVLIEVPARAMQRELVARITEQQGHYAALDGVISLELQRARRLRSSILASAFSGKLVANDPSEEPTSMLLERITSQRTSSNGYKVGKPRTPSQKVTL